MVAQQAALTASDRGPIMNVVAWVSLLAACLATFIKVGIKFARIHNIELDDVYILSAILDNPANSFGRDGSDREQAKYGLGRHIKEPSNSQLQALQRADYASNFFYIVSICLARLAVLQYLTTIALSKPRNAVTKGVIAFNLLWAFAAIMAVSFQCSLPSAWEVLSDHCFNQIAFWDAIGIFDILLDTVLTALTTILIYHVKLAWNRKIAIIAAFSARVLNMPWITLRLIYLSKGSSSSDRTYDLLNASVMTILVANMGIVAACVPFSKPFADYVQSGI